ncbi:MAG TPA: LytR family transcriptional regulator [Ignavibacteria bacterium]|nr:LytR family transcriptional regulator [Ignavibacteria bacterium]
MSFSLILKLQNLNGYNKSDNSKKVLSTPVQVEVLNGCGIAGAADNVTNFLRDRKFDVVQMGNYRTFDIDESIVIDRKGNMKTAENIADSLGINRLNVIQQVNKNYLLDVSIIVGKDYKKLIR